jgi:hypothetical protein
MMGGNVVVFVRSSLRNAFGAIALCVASSLVTAVLLEPALAQAPVNVVKWSATQIASVGIVNPPNHPVLVAAPQPLPVGIVNDQNHAVPVRASAPLPVTISSSIPIVVDTGGAVVRALRIESANRIVPAGVAYRVVFSGNCPVEPGRVYNAGDSVPGNCTNLSVLVYPQAPQP